MKVTAVLYYPLALAGIASAWVTWLPVGFDKASFDVRPNGPHPNSRWMGRLPDDTPLSSLSIPGSHNSWAGDTSSLYPRQLHQCAHPMHQLLAGVRFFDLYLSERNGHLWVSHDTLFGQNDIWTNMRAGHRVNLLFLGAIRLWFQDYRSEGLLIRIRRHPKDIAGGPNQLARFQRAWNANMRPFDSDVAALHGLFGGLAIRNPEFTGPRGKLPDLGQIRGRVLLLLDFEGADEVPADGRRYDGLYFPTVENHQLFDVEDDTPGAMNNFGDVEAKWKRVSKHLDAALFARKNDTKTYITYTSAGGTTTDDYPSPRPSPSPVKKPSMFQKIASSVKSVFQTNVLNKISRPSIPAAPNNNSPVSVPVRQAPIEQKIINKLFVSGNGFISPVMIAGGGESVSIRRSGPAKGINIRTLEKLAPLGGTRRNGKPQRAGIVVMDFPGRHLIDAIVALNFPKPKPERRAQRLQ